MLQSTVTPYNVVLAKGLLFSLSDPRDLMALKSLGLVAASATDYLLPKGVQLIDFYSTKDSPIPQNNLGSEDEHLFVFAPVDEDSFHITKDLPLAVVEGTKDSQSFCFLKHNQLQDYLDGTPLDLEDGKINFSFERELGKQIKVEFSYRLHPTKGIRDKIFGFMINYYQDILLPSPKLDLLFPNQTTQFWRRSKIIPQGNDLYCTFTKVSGNKYILRKSFTAVTEAEKVNMFNMNCPSAVKFVSSRSYLIGKTLHEQV